MEKDDEMKDEEININIESIHIENLIVTNESLDFLKGLSFKSNVKNKKTIDFSEEIDHNINEEECDDIPYIAPKRLNMKRNFDKQGDHDGESS